MPGLSMGILWVGYTFTLYGYCLVRGYNVTLLELVDPRHVPTWASIKASQIPAGQFLPSAGGLTTSKRAGSATPHAKDVLTALKARAARAGKAA
jgi:hypothetical protein